jgi:hypothetical protein
MDIKFLLFALGSLLLINCGKVSKQAEPDDFLNDYLKSETSYLEENKFVISKQITVDGKTENRKSTPIWKTELAFLNKYLNDFRKNGKLPDAKAETKGDTLIQDFQKSAKKSLTILSVNDEFVEFTILENQITFFSSRSFYLNYKSKRSYKLEEHSNAIWIMENNVEIEAAISAP